MAPNNKNIDEYVAIPSSDACDVGICNALYAAPTIFIPASSISVVDDNACSSVDIEANNGDSNSTHFGDTTTTTTEKDYYKNEKVNSKSGESSTVKPSYAWFTIGLLLLLLLDVVVMRLYQLKFSVKTIGIAAINYIVLSLVDTYTSSKIVKNFWLWLALAFLIDGIVLAMNLFMTFISQ